jgi:AcrR family transcriptional regulator
MTDPPHPEHTINEKKEAILKAALAQFANYGFRRTSMEDIARETGMSRAFLYNYFRNKDEIFRSLAERVQEEALEAARRTLDAGGPLAERVSGALRARTQSLVNTISRSAHGEELLDEHGRLGPDFGVPYDEAFEGLLAEALRSAQAAGEIDLGRAEIDADEAAELLRLGSHGFKHMAREPKAFRRRIDAFTRVFFTALDPA